MFCIGCERTLCGGRKAVQLFVVTLTAATLAACARSSVVTNKTASLTTGRQASLGLNRTASFVTNKHREVVTTKHTPFATNKHAAGAPDALYGLASFYGGGSRTRPFIKVRRYRKDHGH